MKLTHAHTSIYRRLKPEMININACVVGKKNYTNCEINHIEPRNEWLTTTTATTTAYSVNIWIYKFNSTNLSSRSAHSWFYRDKSRRICIKTIFSMYVTCTERNTERRQRRMTSTPLSSSTSSSSSSTSSTPVIAPVNAANNNTTKFLFLKTVCLRARIIHLFRSHFLFKIQFVRLSL